MLHQLQRYIREHDLLRAGDRVAVAVSGGADSVALLRLLLELRSELGIVVSVAHLNHQLRGADAERDAGFVAELAERHGLEFHLATRDVRAYAVEHKLSLEAAGRRLRYAFFSALVDEHKVDKVATAHTLDDQAETVLLKLLRGSWLRGLAGIHPRLRAEDGRIWVVRPLLATSRREVEAYLQRLQQPWREDLSNQDRRFRRNRVRQLLPQLEAEHHPGVRAALVTAMIRALAEELKPAATDPGQFLNKLNSDLHAILKHTGTPMLTTAFYLVADWRTGKVRYANAGHPKPLHIRRGASQVMPLANATGKSQPVLGLFEQSAYQTSEVTLAPRDMVMLFTDGLYEVQDRNEALYSQAMLVAGVERRAQLPAPQLFDDLLAEIRRFSGDPGFADDVCMVGMEYGGGSQPRREPDKG